MSTAIKLPTLEDERIEQRDEIGRLVGILRRYGTAPGACPRILVAIDGTEVSNALAERIIEWQQQHHWAFDTHLLLVHDFLGKEAAERLLEEVALADTAAVRERLRAAGISHTLHVLMGNPAPRILERAAAIDAAVILMGTRGHGPIGSVMLGSVAYKVVHEARRPVTLLRA